MAANIYDWSTTAANNANSDGDLTWAEGQAPSTVNNSARVMMQRVKQLLVDLGGSIAASGTANGLTVTANSAYTTLADGQIVAFRASASNTGAATLNVNGIGSKAIRKMDSTGDVPLVANELRNTGLYIVQYSAALNGGAGAWLLVNPTLSAAIYALSGLTTTDNAVARYDGTGGRLQNSGVTIDDSNVVSASSFLSIGVYAANNSTLSFRPAGTASTTGQATLSTAGVFTATTFSGSGASLTNIPAGQLTGTVAAARLTGSYTLVTGTGALDAGSITSNFGSINIGSSPLTCGAPTFSGNTTTNGNIGSSSGSMVLRPNGVGSGVGQLALDSAGNLDTASHIRCGSSVFANVSASTMNFRPNGSGSSVGAATLSTVGVFTASDLVASSDRKLKKHIKPILGALDIVKQLRGVRFTRRKVNTKSIGFIAQEVQEVLPELVHEGDSGKAVAYGNFAAVLVEAVKELSNKVDRLERGK